MFNNGKIQEMNSKQLIVNLYVHNKLIKIPFKLSSLESINNQVEQVVSKYGLKKKASELIKLKILELEVASQKEKKIQNQIKSQVQLQNKRQNKLKTQKKDLNNLFKNNKNIKKNNSLSNQKKVIKNMEKAFNLNKKQVSNKQKGIIIDLRTPRSKDCDSQTECLVASSQSNSQDNVFFTQTRKSYQNTKEKQVFELSSYHKEMNPMSKNKGKKQKIQVCSSKLKKSEKEAEDLFNKSTKQTQQKVVSQFEVNTDNNCTSLLPQLSSSQQNERNSQNNKYTEITINQLYLQYEKELKSQKLKQTMKSNEQMLFKFYQMFVENLHIEEQPLTNQRKKQLKQLILNLHRNISQANENEKNNNNHQKFKQSLLENQCQNL